MMNQYPFYMTNPNLITPIFTINNNIIYNYVVNIANTITTIINSLLNIFTYLFNDIIKAHAAFKSPNVIVNSAG